jgi:hypothetical protein
MRLLGTKLAANSSHRGFGDQLYDLSGQLPSLDLNFSGNKSLTDSASGQNLVTFTRASSGTFVDSDGVLQTAVTDAPRFDHNPTTGESLGLLVEEQRTNLLLQSNQFDTTWTNSNSSETASAGTAPDGTNTAWELKDTLDTISTAHGLTQTISFTTGVAYTFTCWMKAGTLTQGGFVLPSAAFTTAINCRVNLVTGAVLSSSAALATSTTLYANGWIRVTATATATATASGTVSLRPMDGAASYIGTGSGTILIWGAQLEAGAFPTSYIPTTTATVTRSADVASITGASFSSWYRQDEGTYYGSFLTPYVAPATVGQALFSVNDGTANNRNFLSKRANADASTRWSNNKTGGIDTAFINIGTWTANPLQAALVYKENDYAGSLSGAAVGTDATVNLATNLNIIELGANLSSSYLNGTIKRLTYWPTRLSNTTLQQVTQQ